MAWIVRVTVDAAQGDHVASRLWDLHTTGVAEVPLEGTGPARVELLAGFATRAEAEAAGAALAGDGALSPRVEPVDERAWVDPDRTATVDLGGEGPVELAVGGAFGDGGHPTTRLALALVAERVTAGATVLDVGTGTGILALAALRAGAARVLAVDNDGDALAVAGRNLGRHARPGTWELAPALPPRGRFGVVAANLVLGIQRELAPVVGPLVAPGGTLILAGLLTSQEADALALHPDLTVTDRRTDGDWLALALTRPCPAGAAEP